MPPVGFEPTISAGVRLQTYALERAANGTGTSSCNIKQLYVLPTKYIYVFCMDLIPTVIISLYSTALIGWFL